MNPLFEKLCSLKNEKTMGRMDYFLWMLTIAVFALLITLLLWFFQVPLLWATIVSIIVNGVLLYSVYIISIKRHNDMGITSKFRPIVIVATQAYAILVKQFSVLLILLGILPAYTQADVAKIFSDYPIIWLLVLLIGVFRLIGFVFTLIAIFKKWKHADAKKSL